MSGKFRLFMKNNNNNKCAINEGKLEVKEDFLRVNADLVY